MFVVIVLVLFAPDLHHALLVDAARDLRSADETGTAAEVIWFVLGQLVDCCHCCLYCLV